MLLRPAAKTKIFHYMPAGYSQLVPERNDQNYGFETEAEPNLGGRQMYCPRGRGWGAHRRLMQWSIFAAMLMTMTTGASWAIRAGLMKRVAISNGRKIFPAMVMKNITARAACSACKNQSRK